MAADLQSLLSRPRFRRYGDPQYEAIRVGRVDKSRGEAPFLFVTGEWRGETVWVDPRKMDRHLSVASCYYQCSACGQLIHPGELYCNQRWGPWECEDADGWMSARSCRWCFDRAWAYIMALDEDFEERTWSDDNLFAWLDHELGGTHDPLDREGWMAARELLRQAQAQAVAFLTFLRRFAKGAKPAAIRRVGPALLGCGFQWGIKPRYLESYLECSCGQPWPYGVGHCDDSCYLFGPKSLLANIGGESC